MGCVRRRSWRVTMRRSRPRQRMDGSEERVMIELDAIHGHQGGMLLPIWKVTCANTVRTALPSGISKFEGYTATTTSQSATFFPSVPPPRLLTPIAAQHTTELRQMQVEKKRKRMSRGVRDWVSVSPRVLLAFLTRRRGVAVEREKEGIIPSTSSLPIPSYPIT